MFIGSVFIPENSFLIYPLLIFFCLANITFSMALSTLFADSKFSNQLGGVMLFLPLGAFLYLVSTGINTGGGFGELSTDYYGYAYLIYWIPIVPACALITNLVDPPSQCFYNGVQ